MLLPKPYQAKIAQNLTLTSRVHQIFLELVEPKTIEFTAGQFLMFEIQITDNSKQITENIKRAYSIASMPSDNTKVELLIDIAPGGPASQYFSSVAEGIACAFMAPYGQFILRDTPNDKIFIAGSTGVAPMKSMILNYYSSNEVRRKSETSSSSEARSLTNSSRPSASNNKLSLYFGVNKVEEVFLLEEFSALEFEHSNFHFIPVVAEPEAGGGWSGEKGLVTDPLFRNTQDLSGKDFYLCGSPGMVQTVKQQLLDKGIKEENIFNERF